MDELKLIKRSTEINLDNLRLEGQIYDKASKTGYKQRINDWWARTFKSTEADVLTALTRGNALKKMDEFFVLASQIVRE